MKGWALQAERLSVGSLWPDKLESPFLICCGPFAKMQRVILNLDKPQRTVVSGKVMGLANLAYAGLVIGQLIDGDFDVGIAVFGLVMLAGGYGTALIVLKAGEQ